ncbi:alpha/beta fold hydrolase [Nocardioides limicola]|uniref:alpha/beta fold hydrolase n=1 Tax=Nocardioides limicola TaxID=2803368 RepID=UPI00193C4CA8|nr:alpha/beta hydrolase [Nocardioides sp. DJM-14]
MTGAVPGRLNVSLDQFEMACLTWGEVADESRPLAVLLHGFPDTPHTWRHLGPGLAEDGWRVVAPATRGYGPSGLPRDGSYHAPALISDVVELHAALGGDHRALLVGHDWGAITANGLAASPHSPFGRVVAMSVPPIPSFTPGRSDLGSWLAVLPRQARLSWYLAFNQLPRLPERAFVRLVTHLWDRWSPGYDATEDLAHLAAALPNRRCRAAALGYYRAQLRPWRTPARYASYASTWTGAPRVPLLYLQGADDGCLDPRWTTRVLTHLPEGSAVATVPNAGHFLQLEQPEAVARHVLAFSQVQRNVSPGLGRPVE